MTHPGEQHCCMRVVRETGGATAAASSSLSRRIGRRVLAVVRMLTPGAILVLLPKCPLCIVGYAAAAGIGLSISTAENRRSLAFFACLGLLVFFAARQIYGLRRFLPGRSRISQE